MMLRIEGYEYAPLVLKEHFKSLQISQNSSHTNVEEYIYQSSMPESRKLFKMKNVMFH